MRAAFGEPLLKCAGRRAGTRKGGSCFETAGPARTFNLEGNMSEAETKTDSITGVLKRIETVLVKIANQMDCELDDSEREAEMARRSRRKGHPWTNGGAPESR
jgi:hypothetical protein